MRDKVSPFSALGVVALVAVTSMALSLLLAPDGLGQLVFAVGPVLIASMLLRPALAGLRDTSVSLPDDAGAFCAGLIVAGVFVAATFPFGVSEEGFRIGGPWLLFAAGVPVLAGLAGLVVTTLRRRANPTAGDAA